LEVTATTATSSSRHSMGCGSVDRYLVVFATSAVPRWAMRRIIYLGDEAANGHRKGGGPNRPQRWVFPSSGANSGFA
jgi:hypothetical protein